MCADSTLSVWVYCDPINQCGRRYLRGARVVEWELSDDQPSLPGCYGVDVNVTWEIEDPRMWLEPVTAVDTFETQWLIDMRSTYCDSCRPARQCTPETQGLAPVTVFEERQIRGVDVRADQSWCPIGGFPLSELQLFGGEAWAQPEAYSAADASATCDPCATYGVRLFIDARNASGGVTAPNLAFDTIRWSNGVWQSQQLGVPCDCDVEVLEILYILDAPDGGVSVQKFTPATGDDLECCVVHLQWDSPTSGAWASWAGPSVGPVQRLPWSSLDPNTLGRNAAYSGLPPIGCRIQVAREECSPHHTFDLRSCPGGLAPIRLISDGTWEPVGWTHTPFAEWPPPGRDVVIVDQETGPVARTEWQPIRNDCAPGGGAVPLPDPMLDTLDLVDWCEPTTSCAYPWQLTAGACERQASIIVTVAAGTADLRWLRWAVWERVVEYGNMDTAESRDHYRTVEPVAVGEIPLLAAGHKVVFDGQQQKILLDCGNTVVESEAAAFGPYGAFTHPTLQGGVDYIVAFVPHPYSTPQDAWYRVEVVEWEAT